VAGAALLALASGIALSPYRLFLVPVALLVILVFTRLREPALALLAVVPYAVLANLEGRLADTSLYPSEIILLSALLVVALRRPEAFAWRGPVVFALAFGAWMALAALAGAATTDAARVAKLVRTAFLAGSLFALGFGTASHRHGAASWIQAAAGAAGLLGFLAIGEAMMSLRQGVPQVGGVVGGSELLAIHLTLLAPAGLAIVALGADRRPLTRVLVALAGLGLVLSFSRSGWVGGWAAILGMGIAAGKLDRRAGRRLLILAGAILVLAVTLAIVLASAGEIPGAYAARARSIISADLLAGRRSEWGIGLATMRAHPVFGLPEAVNPYNLILGLAAVSGIPILFPFVALLVAAARGARRALGRGDVASGVAAVGLLGAVIGLLVTGIGEASLGARLTPPSMITLGLLAGLGGGAGELAGGVRKLGASTGEGGSER
jgi:hypothetical protein